MERLNQVRSAVFATIAANRQPLVAAGSFVVSRSQRNPTPLFGLGLIDSITDEAILALEKRQAKESPETRGRVSRLKDGRIGRLGWKGQTANVEDFVLNACAVEVGLEVPGHHQAMTPQAPKYRTDGLDLTSEECSALVSYVRSLPQPVERRSAAVRTASISTPAGRPSRPSAVRIATRPMSAMSRGFIATCFSTIWVRRWATKVRMADNTSEDDEPLVPRIIPNLAANDQPAPAPSPPLRAPPARSGRRRPCGASATRVPISTTVAPKPWMRPSRCMAARARPRRSGTSSLRRGSNSRSRRSSNRWSPRPLSGLPTMATEQPDARVHDVPRSRFATIVMARAWVRPSWHSCIAVRYQPR